MSGVGGGRSRWDAFGEPLELLVPGGERPFEGPPFDWKERLRCEGEFERRDDDDDFRLIEVGAASVFAFVGKVRTVSRGMSLSADVVSILRRFGMLPLRGLTMWCGKTEDDGDGEGEMSHSMLWVEEGWRGLGEELGGSISGIAFERAAARVSS